MSLISFRTNIFLLQRFSHSTLFSSWGNKRNRRSRRVESQSSDRDENFSEKRFPQGNATSVDVSEFVNNHSDGNLGCEITEPSQISNEVERLSEQNNNKMKQTEQRLNSKFEEILIVIRTNRDSNLGTDEEDAENNRHNTSKSESKFSGENTHRLFKLRKKKIRITAFSPHKCKN